MNEWAECAIDLQTCSYTISVTGSTHCCGDQICNWGPIPTTAKEPCIPMSYPMGMNLTNWVTNLKLAAVPTVKANIQAALNSTINVVALLRNISATGVDSSQ